MDPQFKVYERLCSDYQFLGGRINAEAVDKFNQLFRNVFRLRILCVRCKDGVVLCEFGSHCLNTHHHPATSYQPPFDESDSDSNDGTDSDDEQSEDAEIYAQYYMRRDLFKDFRFLEENTNSDAISRLHGVRETVLDLPIFCDTCRLGIDLRYFNRHWEDYHMPVINLEETDNESDGEQYLLSQRRINPQFQLYQSLCSDYQYLGGHICPDAMDKFNEMWRNIFRLRIFCEPCIDGVVLSKFGIHWLETHQPNHPSTSHQPPFDESDCDDGTYSDEESEDAEIYAQYYMHRDLFKDFHFLEENTNGEAIWRLHGVRETVFDLKVFCDGCRRGIFFRQFKVHWEDNHMPVINLELTDDESDEEQYLLSQLRNHVEEKGDEDGEDEDEEDDDDLLGGLKCPKCGDVFYDDNVFSEHLSSHQ